MRKSSKDCRADRASVNSRIQAEADAAIKAPPVMSFSAQMPAFSNTSLCLVPSLRTGPACAKARARVYLYKLMQRSED